MSAPMEKLLDRISERRAKGEITRRDFVKGLSILGLSLGLVGGPFSRSAQAAWTIRFDSWGGSTSAAFRKYAFDPFEKKNDKFQVVEGTFKNTDEFLKKVQATFPPGGEYHLVHLGGVFDYARFARAGYQLVLDEVRITNLRNVMPAMIKPLRDITNGTLSGVPYDLGQTGIAYDTRQISEADVKSKGVSLLWDQGLKGKLGGSADWRTSIWFAALHTGQNPNKISDEGDIWSALTEQKGLVRKYWNSGGEQESMLSQGTVWATPAWSGRVAVLQKKGVPIGFYAPKNAYSWQESIFVLKGTNAKLAAIVLNYMLDPTCAIAVAEASGYPPSLDPTKVPMPGSVTKLPAFDPTGKLDGYLFADPDYWNRREQEWAPKCKQILGVG